MSGETELTEEPAELVLAVPLWLIGSAVAAYGLLRGRPLFVLAGLAALAGDRRVILRLGP